MPIISGQDSKGYFFQWGSQKKYYFNPLNQNSINIAYHLAVKQMKAIYSKGYHSY